jgi:hypothetical protein
MQSVKSPEEKRGLSSMYSVLAGLLRNDVAEGEADDLSLTVSVSHTHEVSLLSYTVAYFSAYQKVKTTS